MLQIYDHNLYPLKLNAASIIRDLQQNMLQ